MRNICKTPSAFGLKGGSKDKRPLIHTYTGPSADAARSKDLFSLTPTKRQCLAALGPKTNTNDQRTKDQGPNYFRTAAKPSSWM